MWRNDELGWPMRRCAAEFDGVLLSPGPGTPERAGVSIEPGRALRRGLPLLGVCLGHQAIGVAYGATVDRAPELLHGKTSEVHHDGAGVLHGLPDPFTATRYHSLAVCPSSLPAELEVTARTAGGVVMAVRHRELPDRGRAVPPRVGPHRRRSPAARELAHLLRVGARRYAGASAENEVLTAVRPHFPTDSGVTDRTSA